MAKARGRGAVAGLGFALLLVGLVGGAVLWILAMREPDRAADGFARAAPGCRTTLSFSETGEFYLYEELSGVVAAEGCEPETAPDQMFTWELFGPDGEPVDAVDDTSVSYELDIGAGTSIARVDIDRSGSYEIEVRGNDPAVVAAIGRDPEENVMRLRAAAIAAAAIGLALGGVMLWLSGRRSRRAATVAVPVDPGWGVTERDHTRRAEGAAADDVWQERSAAQDSSAARGAIALPGESTPDASAGDHQWPPRPPSLDDEAVVALEDDADDNADEGNAGEDDAITDETLGAEPSTASPWAAPSPDSLRQIDPGSDSDHADPPPPPMT